MTPDPTAPPAGASPDAATIVPGSYEVRIRRFDYGRRDATDEMQTGVEYAVQSFRSDGEPWSPPAHFDDREQAITRVGTLMIQAERRLRDTAAPPAVSPEGEVTAALMDDARAFVRRVVSEISGQSVSDDVIEATAVRVASQLEWKLAPLAAKLTAAGLHRVTAEDRLADAEANFGNLLAVIFRDGGHRQDEIGDDGKAMIEAMNVVSETREARVTAEDQLREMAGRVAAERARAEKAEAVVKDYGEQIIAARRLREQETHTAGQALAWVVWLPKGYENDYEVYWYEADADNRSVELEQEADEEGQTFPVVPLYTLATVPTLAGRVAAAEAASAAMREALYGGAGAKSPAMAGNLRAIADVIEIASQLVKRIHGPDTGINQSLPDTLRKYADNIDAALNSSAGLDLLQRVEKAEAIVKRLPVTADGVPLTVGDIVYCYGARQTVWKLTAFPDEVWVGLGNCQRRDGEARLSNCYSTRDSALAAPPPGTSPEGGEASNNPTE